MWCMIVFMDKPLSELADAIRDEKSFLEFVSALIADRERAIEAEKQNLAVRMDRMPDVGRTFQSKAFLDRPLRGLRRQISD